MTRYDDPIRWILFSQSRLILITEALFRPITKMAGIRVRWRKWIFSLVWVINFTRIPNQRISTQYYRANFNGRLWHIRMCTHNDHRSSHSTTTQQHDFMVDDMMEQKIKSRILPAIDACCFSSFRWRRSIQRRENVVQHARCAMHGGDSPQLGNASVE